MTEIIQQIEWLPVLDVSIILILLVVFLRMAKGARSFQILIGLAIILGFSLFAQRSGLIAIQWLATGILTQVILVVIIIFQPELRRVLAQIGSAGFFTRPLSAIEETRTLEEIIRAVVPLAEDRIGAILVLERENELWDIVEMGVALDARVSRELLSSIFMPQSPLHDGAVVIRKDRVMAAGCFLPLSLNPDVGRMLGTRHRAALGVTEETDAVVIAVSEETGAISVIMEGKMIQKVDAPELRGLLTRHFLKEAPRSTIWSDRLRGLFPARSKQ